jgi:hypothetical protein
MPHKCEVCDNDEFESLDGYYYCTVCGTKSSVRSIETVLLSLHYFFAGQLGLIDQTGY